MKFISAKLWGGGGAGTSQTPYDGFGTGYSGGSGGFVSCNISVVGIKSIILIVAGGGKSSCKNVTGVSGTPGCSGGPCGFGAGGFGGGGDGYNKNWAKSVGGGGGRSAIRFSVTGNDIVTAAGGGGGGAFNSYFQNGKCGGYGGGGLTGQGGSPGVCFFNI